MQGWLSAYSNNGTNCGDAQGGIPGKKPVWHIPVDERQFKRGVPSTSIMTNMVMTRQTAYYLGDVHTVALDLERRQEAWRAPGIYRAIDGIALRGDYISSGWFVHNRHTGEKCMDLRELTGFDDPGRRQFTQIVPDGFLRYVEGTRNDLMVYNPESNEHRFLGIPLTWSLYHESENLIVGFKGNTLHAIDYGSAEPVWSRELPVAPNGNPTGSFFGYVAAQDHTCVHRREDVLECISNRDGSTIWQSEELLGSGKNFNNCHYVGCIDKTIYVLRHSTVGDMPTWMLAIDVDTGVRRLEKQYGKNEYKNFAMNGDVLFSIVDYSKLIAMDRFTGDVIWQSAEPMEAAFKCITAGNRVIYGSTMNEIRIYEWDAPYISPNRW